MSKPSKVSISLVIKPDNREQAGMQLTDFLEYVEDDLISTCASEGWEVVTIEVKVKEQKP